MKQLAYRQQQGNKGYLPKIEKPPPQKPRGREEAYRITDNGIFRWPYGAQRRQRGVAGTGRRPSRQPASPLASAPVRPRGAVR